MQIWRRDIHSHPEIAFEEHGTAKIVAEKLESFGIEVKDRNCWYRSCRHFKERKWK